MTTRHSTLILVFCSVLVLGGGFLANPLQGAAQQPDNKQVEDLQKEVEKLRAKLDEVDKSRPLLEHWRRLSLPADVNAALRNYRKELENLIRKHGLTLEQFSDNQANSKSPITHPDMPNKMPIWRGVDVAFRVKAKLSNVISFLHEFQSLPLMHRIKAMTIERSSRPKENDQLSMQISIEALIILDADKAKAKVRPMDRRYTTLDSVAGMHTGVPNLGMVAWYLSPQGPFVPGLLVPSPSRTYADIARKNIFIGMQEPQSAAKPMPGESARFEDDQLAASENDDIAQDKGQPKLADLQALKAQYEKELKALNTEMKYLEALQDWQAGAISWIDELYDLTARLPWQQGFSISRLEAGPIAAKSAADQFRARLRITGLIDAESVAKLDSFKDLVNKDKHCQCSLNNLKKTQSGALEFNMIVNLAHQPPSNFLVRLAVPLEAAPKKKVPLAKDTSEKPKDLGPKADDEVINMMRFNRFISLVSNEDGQPEAKLWNMYHNIKVRISAKPGLKTFGMVQTGKLTPVIQGRLLKMEKTDIIYRVELKTSDAPPGAVRNYPDAETIYHIQTAHFKELVAAGNKAKKENKGVVLNPAEIERVFVMKKDYWDLLVWNKILTADPKAGTFRFYKDLTCGDVVSQSDDLVVFRHHEKYCKCPADPDKKTAERWHEGICVLHVDQFVQDSLWRPLPEDRVKEFIKK